MSRVEILEREITSLSPEELAELRRWFAEISMPRIGSASLKRT